MDNNALTTRQGTLWVQPNGPNTQSYLLGCHDLGDITESAGSIELLRCMDKRGGWRTVGATQSPPDPISTSIENMTFLVRDWLEKLECNFNLFAFQSIGGEADSFDNYDRALILVNARVTSITNSGIVHHEEESPSLQSRDIEAWPPLIRTGVLTTRRQETSETLALNDVYSYSPLDCVNRILPGDMVMAVADAGLYGGDVLQTLNAGQSWAALAVDPFASGDHIMSGVAFKISSIVTRILVAKQAESGQQGQVAYSDDNGATWTLVSIGGASAGHGALDSGALFALDQGHIWLASALGYIYYSSDGGASWTAQTSGTLTVENGLCVSFSDSNNGMAGFEDDVILVTTDGGETWEEADAVTGSGDDITTVSNNFGDFWWVGTSGGEIYYSRDMGETWTIRAFTGHSVGAVADMAWANELVGYMIHNSAAPVGRLLVTINGGYSWLPVQTPENAGLNALSIADTSTVYVVGEPEGGTAVIIKATWD